MSDVYIMGYKVNTNLRKFMPQAVLFTKNDEKITVEMVQSATDYILGILAIQNPLVAKYKKAKIFFSAINLILENKQPPKISKDDVKIVIDVLEEIHNMYAKSDAEKIFNARCALQCKLMVISLGGNDI